MKNSEDALRAYEKLNGCTLGGRLITVNDATPRKFPSKSSSDSQDCTTPRRSSFDVTVGSWRNNPQLSPLATPLSPYTPTPQKNSSNFFAEPRELFM